jgi:23S rRNA (cytidine1920-2'-O)/16S rRNA (cytidine1409-2'-O)-methyltransferase
VRDGLVLVSGRSASKPSTLVDAAAPLELVGEPRRFASRAGEKLEAALERFAIDVQGRDGLDAGASTGGFTDCLLRRGAAHVVAVDVGYGQLAWVLRTDRRVTVLDRTNVRDLRPGDLPYAPGIVVADLSFISLRLAIPALARVCSGDADLVLLVKPQFEVGRERRGFGGRRPRPGRLARRDPRRRGRELRAWPLADRRDGLAAARGRRQHRVPSAREGGPGGAVVLDVEGALEEARAIAGVSS